MLIIARTTGVQTVVTNGDSNTLVVWQCRGRNGGKQEGAQKCAKFPGPPCIYKTNNNSLKTSCSTA